MASDGGSWLPVVVKRKFNKYFIKNCDVKICALESYLADSFSQIYSFVWSLLRPSCGLVLLPIHDLKHGELEGFSLYLISRFHKLMVQALPLWFLYLSLAFALNSCA